MFRKTILISNFGWSKSSQLKWETEFSRKPIWQQAGGHLSCVGQPGVGRSQEEDSAGCNQCCAAPENSQKPRPLSHGFSLCHQKKKQHRLSRQKQGGGWWPRGMRNRHLRHTGERLPRHHGGISWSEWLWLGGNCSQQSKTTVSPCKWQEMDFKMGRDVHPPHCCNAYSCRQPVELRHDNHHTKVYRHTGRQLKTRMSRSSLPWDGDAQIEADQIIKEGGLRTTAPNRMGTLHQLSL